MPPSENSSVAPPAYSQDGDNTLDGHAHVGALPVNSYNHSPYTDTSPFYLDIGPNKARFLVHRTILSQSPEFEVKQSDMLWGASDSLPLPDLDEKTAHTLVHYLYTGAYQTLDTFEESLNPFQKMSPSVKAAYKLGTCVYCASTRYQLPGLAALAQEKIRSISARLPIFDILAIAREQAFPNLPQDEKWYAEFVDEAIKAAVIDDPDLFTKAQFIEQIGGDNRFKQVVVSAMLNSYGRGPASVSAPSVSERPTELSTPAMDARSGERLAGSSTWDAPDTLEEVPEQDLESSPAESGEEHRDVSEVTPSVNDDGESRKDATPVQEPVTEEPVISEAFEALSIEPQEIEASAMEESLKLDEIEPTQTTHTEPEPFTDELGFGNSKTYQNQLQRRNTNTSVSVSELPSPSHKRNDSGIQPVEPLESPPPAVEEKDVASPVASPEPAPETAPAAASETPVANGDKPTQKKNKNRKKKKNPTTFGA